ncbi:LrgB family protein [Aureimonas fodinaquatilis]|uniref:LrgB family protein n=1 Tax=Aureimonas fodinaquatilis TaxID=2565783 RepID=A0A5B0DR30_9HYPH|nr:LrgB family protein [Aureimonas fodinaquatilis]KAA0968928.1 LrgB family protein [Aureimonas fodinaquatilis]
MTEVNTPFQLWAYLSTSPLLWLTVTVLAWLAADAIAVKTGRHPLANPVLLSIIIIGTVLHLTATDYRTYFTGAQFVHFLLGPATVALAIPLYRARHLILRNLLPLGVSLIAGSIVAIASTVIIAGWFDLPQTAILSLAPKSATAPVAMGISQQIGGQPALTAAFCVLTGVIGALMITPMMNAMRIKNYAARGFAVGLAAHGIGTARAFTVNSVAGAFAGIAMGLNALITAVILPPLIGWLMN